jgi:hypothetical protein
MLVCCLAYSSALKMEMTCFSKTSVDFQQTTQGYIPEYSSLWYLDRCGCALTTLQYFFGSHTLKFMDLRYPLTILSSEFIPASRMHPMLEKIKKKNK